jgi:hypothetical protein
VIDRPLVKWVALAVAVVPVALISASLLIGSTPDEEEFRFAVLTTWLHVRTMMQGHYDFWTPLLGLGAPQPLTPNFLLHPLSPLLPVLGPIAWSRTVVVAHTLLGAGGMWHVTKRLALSPIVRAICVVSFLLATPVQNYVLTDFWPSHYVVWTSMPWLLLLAWRGLEAEERVLRRVMIALGLCGGLVVANTNPGHVIVYTTVASAVAIANWRRVASRWQWFVLAAVLAAAIASPTLVQLAHERTFFASDVQRSDVPDPLPPAASWTALFSPIPPPSSLPINEQLPFTRTLFFGGPFLALAIAGCFWFAGRRFDLVLALVLSAILLFTSFLSVPGVSARFHFRDPLTLAAILLAGLTLERLLSVRRARILVAGLAVVQVIAVVWSAWPALSRTWEPDAQAARWFRGATGDAATVDTLLTLMRIPGRVVFSPDVDRAMYARELLDDGLGVNALAYRGVPIVNGWFKGISADSVWPDERLFYARVQAPRPFVASNADLDVLGIRYVVARVGEPVAPELVSRGTLRLRNGTELAVYENDDAWPEAFLLDVADLPSVSALPQCETDRLLCKDLSALRHRGSTARVTVAAHGAEIDVELTAADRPATLVISQMFRPDWTATVDGRFVRVTPVAGALLGVTVPAGARSVHLRYRPTPVIVATVVAWIAIVTCVAALVVRGKPRRWRS